MRRSAAQIAVPAGVFDNRFTLTFPTIPRGSAGTTYARFRLSTDAAATSSIGSAFDGEVEDYVFTIHEPSSGSVKAHVKISDGLGGFHPTALTYSDYFGGSSVSLGDLDGDGVVDLAVGAYNDEAADGDEGAVYVLMMQEDGTVRRHVKISDGLAGFNPTGLDAGDKFGFSLANFGDLDGDGVVDLAVGAFGDENTDAGEGAVYILMLNSDGTVKRNVKISDGLAGFNPSGLETFAGFGASITNIGDLDGDGVVDLAVGARADAGEGAVYVLMMNSDGTVKRHVKISYGLAGFSPSGPNAGGFGTSVAGLGDLDADGVVDLAVGALGEGGAVYVLLMNSDATVKRHVIVSAGLAGFTPSELDSNDFFGFSLATLGDLNGDGVIDLAVGAVFDEVALGDEQIGAVYVLLMNANGSVKTHFRIIAGEAGFNPVGLPTRPWFGSSLASLGDLNGDGAVDLAVGAMVDEHEEFREGALYVLLMNGVTPDYGDAPDSSVGTGAGNYKTTAADNGPSHVYYAGLFLGNSVDGDNGILHNPTANADDVDGLSSDDEDGVLSPLDLVGAVNAQPSVTLQATNITSSPAFLSGWIDYNQDGIFDDATERAQTIVPPGVFDNRFTLTFPVIPDGSAGTTYARFRLSTDTAANHSTGAAADGEVEDYLFTINRPTQGTVKSHTKISDGLAGFHPIGLDAFDTFGSAVTTIGDLDGNGVVDLAVGAPLDENGESAEGAVYVLMMNDNGTVKDHVKISDGLAGFTPAALNLFDQFGGAVAGIGDLDGDGIPDLAVGASQDSNFQAAEGAVYVLFLNSDGTVKRHTKISDGLAGFTPSGLDGDDHFGSSLVGLGDLDGDGVVDLAVGASEDERSGSGEGAVYVLMLNRDGSVKTHIKISDGLSGFSPTGLDDNDQFGISLANLGDVDGDGVVDLAVGAQNDEGSEFSEGAVYVLLLHHVGTVKSHVKISDGLSNFHPSSLESLDYFGSSVAGLGDLDGDGVNDLVVGATGDEAGDPSEGAIYLLLLNDDGTVKRHAKIGDGLAGLNGGVGCERPLRQFAGQPGRSRWGWCD